MTEPFNQAQFIADKFGGAGSMADAIGVPYHRVSHWVRSSRFIPEKHRPDVLRAARARGIDVTPYDFIRHLIQIAA